MKHRILNLNEVSLPALGLIAVTGLVIPAVLYLAWFLFERAGLHLPVIFQFTRGFLAVGAGLLLLFFVLVVLEQIQDHLLYKRYIQERARQAAGECPYCGNRRMQSFEHTCLVCGAHLERKM